VQDICRWERLVVHEHHCDHVPGTLREHLCERQVEWALLRLKLKHAFCVFFSGGEMPLSAVAARAVLAGVAGGYEAGLRRRALRSEHSAPLPAAAGPAAMRRRQHLGRLPLLRGPTWARRCSTHRWAPLPPTSSSSPNTTPTRMHTNTHTAPISILTPIAGTSASWTARSATSPTPSRC